MSSNESQQNPMELVQFYIDQLNHYRKWAELHKLGYWVLVWCIIVCGSSLMFALLLKVDSMRVAVIAVSLNVLFFVNQVVQSDRKDPHYRTNEIRLSFGLQAFKLEVARRIEEGKTERQAILDSLVEFHKRAEALALEEYSNFFKQMKTVEELYQRVLDQPASMAPKAAKK